MTTLQALVQIPTDIDRDPANVDGAAFDEALNEFERRFPLVHEHLELTRVATHGLLFRWAGNSAAKPVVMLSHLDVVPVEGQWQHPPFSGKVVGTNWGRGPLEDKGSLVSICAAVERLLANGFVPAQDVWLSSGCNEEVSGTSAVLAVEELQARGVQPWFVIDEGGAIASESFPGVAFHWWNRFPDGADTGLSRAQFSAGAQVVGAVTIKRPAGNYRVGEQHEWVVRQPANGDWPGSIRVA